MTTMTRLSVAREDPSWHEWRRQGIGGSDIAAICGLSPWASPFSLYLTKRGEVPEEDLSDNPAVELGKRIEPIIPAWFHDRTGLYLVGEQTWCEHPEIEHHRCTLDAFVAESPASGVDGVLGVCEIKVTGDSEATWETIPNHYAVQGQWQLHVTGMEHLWFAVLHRHSGRFAVYEMERDETVIAELVRLAGDFWQRVMAGNPPPTDGHEATTRALREAYPLSDNDEEVEIPAELITEIRVARGRMAAVEAELDALENELKARLGTAGTAVVDGVKVATWRTQTANRVDLKALRAAHPDLASEFSNTSTSRVLRIAKER